MGQTFGRGAQGFLVKAFQEGLERAIGRRLPSGPDGQYYGETEAGVVEFANMQTGAVLDALRSEGALAGRAGIYTWTALKLEWPEIFARCLQLTSCFEGTGFAGSCGPRETSDTAGVTFGVIGFTSYNGELQDLLQAARVDHPDEFNYLGKKCLGADGFRRALAVMADEDHRAFEQWALDKRGSVLPTVKVWLEALGELPWMKHLEMQWAYTRYWKNIAVKQGDLLFSQPSPRALALLFDIAVQNGGLKALEISDLQIDFRKDPVLTEKDRMNAVATKLIERLRIKGRPSNIIEDVRSRKNTITLGVGKVHGDIYQVRGFAL